MMNQSLPASSPQLFCFGLGYSAAFLFEELLAQGWKLAATSRDEAKRKQWQARGVQMVAPDDGAAIGQALEQSAYWLVSVPPGDGQVQAMALCQSQEVGHVKWLGYFSSTGVYGDAGGAWVDEQTPPNPHDERAQRRLDAEQQWVDWGRLQQVPTSIFRLAGIYGPRRNALESAKAGTARRIVKDGHVFSRIHVEDIVQAVQLAMRKEADGVYNICDDEAAASHAVVAYACERLGISPPPEEPFASAELSPMMRSFYAANRLVANDRMKRELGVCLRYPSYREGLNALHQQLMEESA